MVTAQDIAAFREQGYLVCRGLLDVDASIVPLRRAIQQLVRELASGHGVTLTPRPQDGHGTAFDDDYRELVAARPELHSVLYDAVKMLVPFIQLTAHPTVVALFKRMYDTDVVGRHAGGVGIRIDRPDNRHLVPWHQDFVSQLRSTRAATFWVPLVAVPNELGPIAVCAGSHRLGPVPFAVNEDDDRVDSGVYEGLLMEEGERHVASYAHVESELVPGDVLVFDAMTLHRSGRNTTHRTRWSCQLRLFAFADDFGRKCGWRGSFKDGLTVPEINLAVAAARATHS